LSAVIGAAGRFQIVDYALNDDAQAVAGAHKVIEGVAHVKVFGNEEGVYKHQDASDNGSDQNVCDKFAHALNVAFLGVLAGILKIILLN